jgi:MFS family permease
MDERERPQTQDSPADQPRVPADTMEPAGTPVAPARRHAALLIVFLVMFIDLLGFGIVLPLLPLYADNFLQPLFPSETQAGIRGMLLGGLMSSFSLMQFLVAPVWGRLSDRHGRRPFLLLGLIGSVFSYGLFGFASDWGAIEGQVKAAVILLFVARIGAGIAGATVSTAQAVIADSTTPEKRSRGMALIGAAFGLGFTFGPALAAACQALYPDFWGLPGYVAAGCSLLALVLGLAIMPETRRPGVTAGRRHWLNLDGVRLAFRTPTVGTLILIFFLSTLAFGNFESTLALAIRDVLRFVRKNNALVFVYVGIILLLAQGGLYQMLARRGVRETSFMLAGGLLLTLGLAGIGVTAEVSAAQEIGFRSANVVSLMPSPGGHGALLAASALGPGITQFRSSATLVGAFLIASTAAVVGFALVTPSVQALISRRSDPEKQGEILGVSQSVNALSRILGPAAGPTLYLLTLTHVLPYVFAVTLLLCMLGLTLRVRRL